MIGARRETDTEAEIEMSNIGLLNEKSLHASLKEWYAQPGDQFEVTVDGFVIDIVRDNLLLEIQTGNFASIKSKLITLLRTQRIRLIYPIAQEKWIVKQAMDNGGGVTYRKSPKRGRVEELFWEMVSFPHLIMNPNFSLEVLLIRGEEVRRFEKKKNWRRRGWVTEERRLLEVVDRRLFEEAADLKVLLPEKVGETFTMRDLAEAIDIGRLLAQ
ncbi:MAG: hypothetical protein SVW57_11190, partial [Thermodesulfobacteriota bacterium]|nr:hypothetical protein [Thermodesulfobacteriota bacterium]